MPMRQRSGIAAEVEGALKVFRSEGWAARIQRMEQHADRRDAHHPAATFAVVAGRLSNVQISLQGINAGSPRRPTGEQGLLFDQPATEQEFPVTWFMLALGVQPTQVGIVNTLPGLQMPRRVARTKARKAPSAVNKVIWVSSVIAPSLP